MGTVVQTFEPLSGYSIGVVIAELYTPNSGTVFPPGWAFTAPGTNQAVIFPSNAVNYGGGDAVVMIDWYAPGITSGTCTWKVFVIAQTPGDAEAVEAATNATSTSQASTVNATSGGLTRCTVNVLAASLDSMAAGDKIYIRVERDPTDTSIAAQVILTEVTLNYSDGLAGSPGTGDVVGPAGATSGRVAVYNGATGKLLQNGTKLESDLVTGPASSTTGNLPSYNGTTGKVIQDSGVAAASVVVGPASATSGNLASYSGTTGKLVADSGVVAANVVTGPASATTGRVASFNGTTGKIIQDAGVLASTLAQGPGSSTSGNIASWNGTGGLVLQDSGVSATAHAARHQVGGADSLFSGTFATSDTVQWNGSAWAPRFTETAELSATASIASGAGTLADVTGLTMSLPRAGTYRFSCRGAIVSSGTAGHFLCAMNYTGTVTRIVAGGTYYLAGTAAGFMYFVQTANNALVSTTGAGTATNGTQGITLDGLIVVSTTGTLSWRFARANASTTATIQTATGFTVWET